MILSKFKPNRASSFRNMTILQMACGNSEKDQLNIDGHMFATTRQIGLNFGMSHYFRNSLPPPGQNQTAKTPRIGWVKSDNPYWRPCQLNPWVRGSQPPNMGPKALAIGQRFELEVLLYEASTGKTVKPINLAWLKFFYYKVIAVYLVMWSAI